MRNPKRVDVVAQSVQLARAPTNEDETMMVLVVVLMMKMMVMMVMHMHTLLLAGAVSAGDSPCHERHGQRMCNTLILPEHGATLCCYRRGRESVVRSEVGCLLEPYSDNRDNPRDRRRRFFFFFCVA